MIIIMSFPFLMMSFEENICSVYECTRF